MISQILSLGYLPAVVLTGYWVVSNPLKNTASDLSSVVKMGISVTIGMMLWFPLLFTTAWLNIFDPSWIGIAGWIASLFLALRLKRELKVEGEQLRSKESVVLLTFAIAVFVFNGIFTSESIMGGRDQGLYSTHGAHIANTGMLRSELPYEKLYENDNYQIAGPTNPGGFFYDVPKGDMYLQFSPTLAIHLAQFFGIGDYEVLLLFNPFIASVSILLFFGLASLFLVRNWTYLATGLYALNASQIWNARITLSEIIAQNLILGGLGLAVAAFRVRHRFGYSVACIIASSAAFTRVDGFLIPAFLISANVALFLYAQDPSKDAKLLKSGSFGALATAILAYFYNLLSAPLYFLDFALEVNSLVAVSLVGALGLIFIEKSKALRNAATIFTSPRFINRIVVLLVILVLYGFFIRPHIEPFAQFADSHYGTRNYQENSLIDLSKYISIPTIAFALIGACIVLIGLRKDGKKETLLLLIPWLGFSIVYLYDPRISADHIWRIRRFTPLVIPGFVLFATIGVSYLATKYLGSKGQKSVFAISAVWCGIFLSTSLSPIAFLKQYEGTLSTIRSISESLPKGALTLANVSSEILGPLQLGEGHKMIRDHLNSEELSPIVSKIIEQEFEQGREIFLLSQAPQSNSNFAIPVGSWRHHIPRLKRTPNPPARETHIQKRNLYLYQLTSSIHKILPHQSYYSFGGTKGFSVEENGLYGQEFNGETPFRWTNGEAVFVLKPSITRDPINLILKAHATHPKGSIATIFINGTQVFDGPISHENLTINTSLESATFRESHNEVRITSNKWIPSDLLEGSSDSRELGIAIEDITLMFDESIQFENVRFGNIPAKGIEESGLYPVEFINGRYARWTTGHAIFELELKRDYDPAGLELDITGVRDLDRNVVVKWNDQVIHTGPLNPNLETLTLDLEKEKTTSHNVKIEVICEPFVPASIGLNSDTRALGLQIAGIRLRSAENK